MAAKEPVPLMATFRPQAWISDHAINVDGAVQFNATKKLLAMPLEQIRKFREHDYDSDELAEGLPAREQYHGPFEVDVDLEAWFEANGIDDYRWLTEAQLEQLRERYKWSEEPLEDIVTGHEGECLYCHDWVREVKDPYSGVLDYETYVGCVPSGDFGCPASPETNEEGTGGHWPLIRVTALILNQMETANAAQPAKGVGTVP